MNEYIKKEVQDVELNPEDLDKVAGGMVMETQKCALCGSPMQLKFFSEDTCYYNVCSNPDCENAKKQGPKINLITGPVPEGL